VTSCIVDSAAVYIITVIFRNAITVVPVHRYCYFIGEGCSVSQFKPGLAIKKTALKKSQKSFKTHLKAFLGFHWFFKLTFIFETQVIIFLAKTRYKRFNLVNFCLNSQ
jgi:hypothetical protein